MVGEEGGGGGEGFAVAFIQQITGYHISNGAMHNTYAAETIHRPDTLLVMLAL